MTNQMGVMMYGPRRWAAMTRNQAAPLGWSWSDVGSGIVNIGKGALDIFTASKQTEAYKTLAEQQAAERAALVNTVIKAAAVVGLGVVAINLFKSGKRA